MITPYQHCCGCGAETSTDPEDVACSDCWEAWFEGRAKVLTRGQWDTAVMHTGMWPGDHVFAGDECSQAWDGLLWPDNHQAGIRFQNEYGYIRTNLGHLAPRCCPIEALGFVQTGVFQYYRPAANMLGLSNDDRGEIICTADEISRDSPWLRQRMLSWCQVPETEAVT